MRPMAAQQRTVAGLLAHPEPEWECHGTTDARWL